MIAVRDAVSKGLEKLRIEGAIGSALDAEVDLYCDEALYALLGRLEDELRFVLITSYGRIHKASERPDDAEPSEVPGLWIKVVPSTFKKCVRCWHRREEVGQNAGHPGLCARCVVNVTGAGEARRYA